MRHQRLSSCSVTISGPKAIINWALGLKPLILPGLPHIYTVLSLHLNPTNVEAMTKGIVASWSADTNPYPLRIIDGTESAVVFFEDTPAMFGAELRETAALD